MTSREHILLITMFSKQLQLIKTLAEILRSRGVLDADDLAAFGALVRSDTDATLQMLEETKDLYLKAAKGFGVKVQGVAD
jgi:hypothetical protein